MRGRRSRLKESVLCIVCAALVLLGSKDVAQSAAKQRTVGTKDAAMIPHLFQEGIISTEDDEVNGSFSPDGSEYYFSKVNQYTTGPSLGIICVSYLRESKWSQPVALPFSGEYLDFGPRLSTDGQTMYFSSNRPIPGKRPGTYGIWSAARTANGWADPTPLPAPINSKDNHFNLSPSVARNGAMYFSSSRGGKGHFHIYRSELVNGTYAEPEELGPEINSDFSETDPYISADEDILIFASTGDGLPTAADRPETLQGGGVRYARADLYISTKENGKWSRARHLEHDINSTADETSPSLSPDGKYLFFSSERSSFTIPTAHRMNGAELERQLHSTLNGHGNIFYISTQALKEDSHK